MRERGRQTGGGGGGGKEDARCIWSGQNKGQYLQTGIVGIFTFWVVLHVRDTVEDDR